MNFNTIWIWVDFNAFWIWMDFNAFLIWMGPPTSNCSTQLGPLSIVLSVRRSGNAFWYFDGYYSDLVYYDFQADHDTGEDDHSDGIVRRYSDIVLSRWADTSSHIFLDKGSGILYI